MKTHNVMVVGAGLMGHGIAYLFAAAGHRVRVFDRAAGALASLPDRVAAIAQLFGDTSGAVDRISGHGEFAAAAHDAAFVIEAAPENLDLKRFIVAELESVIAPETIIASNTSAIPITAIAAKAFAPERIVGAHFWNPPHLVRLVEVVEAERTSQANVAAMLTFLNEAGQHAVHVKRDIPGFIGNRLQHALKREAIALVAAGVCDATTVDDVVKHGFGQRLAVLGPMEQSDLVGLPLTKAIQDTLLPDLDRTTTAHPYLEQRLAQGHTGMASGEGFRTWTAEEADAVRKRLNAHLLAQARSANPLPARPKHGTPPST